MGGSCGTYGREESDYMVLVEKPEKRDHLEDLRLNGRIILKCIFKK
jgi:hypothetical protein